MKRLLPLLLLLLCSLAAWSQTSTESATTPQSPETAQSPTPSQPSSSGERLFFPKDWYYGWAEFDLAPPHNEIDPNLCAADAGSPQFGGKNAPCSAFARYQLAGSLELRPFGRTIARRLMIFYEPNFLFGKNLPQTLYTWSWSGIGMEVGWGVAADLPKHFQFRYTNHPTIVLFGSRDQPLGGAWLGSNGPWGQYNTIGVRKYFGTRREGTD